MSAVAMQPLYDNILLRRCADDLDESKSAAGLILLADYDRTHYRATVEAVGLGRLTRRGVRLLPSVSVGDTVLISPRIGTPVVGTIDYILVREDDILAVAESKP